MVGTYLNDHRMGKVAQSWPLGCKCTLTAHVELFGPQTSWSLSPGLVLISFPPRLYLCGDCLDPRAGPCTWPLWTSWGLHKPPFKACQGPSGWLPFPLAHQLCATQLGVSSKLAEGALSPNTGKDVKNSLFSITAWGESTPHCFLLDIELVATTLSAPIQPNFIYWKVYPLNPHLFTLQKRMSCRTVSTALHKSVYIMSCALPSSAAAVTPL